VAEERLIIWHGIPDGSFLRIQVTPQMATVEGTGFMKTAAGNKTPLALREGQLVDQPLNVLLRQGDRFFLLIEMK
jgi:hypothetical protein